MCAVVPSGIGRLNIIKMNASAAMNESIGTFRGPRFLLPFLNAKYHITIITRNSVIQVAGPRYPSGICMRLSPVCDDDREIPCVPQFSRMKHRMGEPPVSSARNLAVLVAQIPN